MTPFTQDASCGKNIHAKKRILCIFSILIFLVLLLAILNIGIGSVFISPAEIIYNLVRPDGNGSVNFIIWKIRLPRTLGAAMGGAYLAVSGLMLQVFFRNPIVGPFILGISSGATVMVSLVMLTSLTLGLTAFIPYMTTFAAFAGAYAVMLMVLFVSARVRNGVTLLIVGLMMGYLCSAVTAIFSALAEKEKIKGFVLWQLGSFSGFKWSEIWVFIVVGGAFTLLCYTLSKPLNAFLLGEEYAASMGVNIRRFRILIPLCACVLAGMVTSVAGPVAFIGLAVPHMARLSFGSSDNRILIPGVVLFGAIVTSLCDLVSRMVLSPVELPLSAITSFFGAPIVIGLLLRKKVQL